MELTLLMVPYFYFVLDIFLYIVIDPAHCFQGVVMCYMEMAHSRNHNTPKVLLMHMTAACVAKGIGCSTVVRAARVRFPVGFTLVFFKLSCD